MRSSCKIWLLFLCCVRTCKRFKKILGMQRPPAWARAWLTIEIRTSYASVRHLAKCSRRLNGTNVGLLQRSAGKIWPLAFCLSSSLKVIETAIFKRSGTYAFLVIYSNQWQFWTYLVPFPRQTAKLVNFPTPVYLRPSLRGFSLEFCNSSGDAPLRKI